MMKKTIFYLAASLVMIAGCAKEETPSTHDCNETITVMMPEISTKTAFGEENQKKLPLVWNAGDKIAVVQGLGTEREKKAIYVLDGEGGSSAGQFKYESGATDISKVTDIIYPSSTAANTAIPADQTYTAGSFDPKSVVMTWNNPSGLGEEGAVLETEASVICLMLKSSNGAKITKIQSSLTYGADESTMQTYVLDCPKVELTETAMPFYITVTGSENVCNAVFKVSHSAITETLPAADGKTFSAFEVSRFPVYDVVAQKISVTFPELGSIYEGGVVFDINMEEAWVKVISIDAPATSDNKLKWATSGSASVRVDGGTLETGEEKALLFRELSESELSKFPAAEWCINKGEGWYLPAHGEIKTFNKNLEISSAKNDTSGEGIDKQNAINATVVAAGGTAFKFNEYHWCCEESASDKARYSRPCDAPLSTGTNPGIKTNARYVRAVKKITIN